MYALLCVKRGILDPTRADQCGGERAQCSLPCNGEMDMIARLPRPKSNAIIHFNHKVCFQYSHTSFHLLHFKQLAKSRSTDPSELEEIRKSVFVRRYVTIMSGFSEGRCILKGGLKR